MKLTAIMLLTAFLTVGMAYAGPPAARPIRFAVLKEDTNSVSQIIGLCDGTREDDEFGCRLARINLVKGDELQRKVLGGGPEQCVLGVSSDGQEVKFRKTADNTWIAVSPPSVLCGIVSSYTLASAGAHAAWKLTITSKKTDSSMPMCKSLGETSEEFYIGLPSLACQNVKFGPNPGF
ncbi:hypothetical protein [Xanthomonas sacchari]|uniref:hypothetical protein n=1 Tax=Xanthomonas sacchari TaxID=56458 RepID=UPI002253AF0C|nr:hypothetical protein [Xanthomonas sacchari]